MTIREIREEDKPAIEDWIEADDDHRGKMTAEFFFAPLALGLAFEDDDGPVFYVRLDPEKTGAVRVHIQFGPAAGGLRTARMLTEGFFVVRERARMARARALIFDSITPRLREFCRRRFGFTAVEGTNDLFLALEANAAQT